MKIALGSDHAGFAAKEEIKYFLKGELASPQAAELFRELEVEVIDQGCYDESACDFPEFAHRVARGVAKGEFDRGILLCGTGIGMSIAANRTKGARAALCYDLFGAKMSRLHNDANVLCLGGRMTGFGLMKEIVYTWLATPFEGGRHERRAELIDRSP